jgi:glycosyltransferase involved in cell wall biosynthesis
MNPQRPRVLHFIDTTGPGGAETVFLSVADGMRARGWDARAIVVGPGWVLDRVHALDLPVDVVETHGRLDTRYLRSLRSVVRRHGIGLIHAHLLSPAVYATAVGLTTGTPVVSTFHGASDVTVAGRRRTLRHRLVERGGTVVCVSEPLRDDLAVSVGARSANVRVIHNGVDVDRFAAADGRAVRRAFGIADDTVLVGALGNVRPAKDYQTLLRAAALCPPDVSINFAIVGEPTEPLYGELCALRDELGLGGRVAFWGFRDDVPEVLSAFDILAISSESEGFSLAAVQAMAAGTPVVATRSGGPERIITHGVDGMLVPARSPSSLAAAIRQLAACATMRERFAQAARQTVVQRFSMGRMLDEYEQLYDQRIAAR